MYQNVFCCQEGNLENWISANLYKANFASSLGRLGQRFGIERYVDKSLRWSGISISYLKRMTFVSFIDCSQNRFVDSEAHGGSDESQGQVSNNAEDCSSVSFAILLSFGRSPDE